MKEDQIHSAINEFIEKNKAFPSEIRSGYMASVSMTGIPTVIFSSTQGLVFITPVGHLQIVTDISMDAESWEVK